MSARLYKSHTYVDDYTVVVHATGFDLNDHPDLQNDLHIKCEAIFTKSFAIFDGIGMLENLHTAETARALLDRLSSILTEQMGIEVKIIDFQASLDLLHMRNLAYFKVSIDPEVYKNAGAKRLLELLCQPAQE